MVRRAPKKPTKVGADKRYLDKAQNFLNGCKSMFEQGNWDSCGVLAVHAAISACDSICSKLLQVRSAGSDHMEAVGLVMDLPINANERKAKARQLERILRMKNAAEYEDRELEEDEACEMLRDAERLLKWVESKFT